MRDSVGGAYRKEVKMKRKPKKANLKDLALRSFEDENQRLHAQVQFERVNCANKELAMRETLTRAAAQMIESLARMIGGPGF